MGFSTKGREDVFLLCPVSQSLSGWGGVFNGVRAELAAFQKVVAIPFRVGWGFQLRELYVVRDEDVGRNPFQGGVFNLRGESSGQGPFFCRNPFQGGVGFSTSMGSWRRYTYLSRVAIPFRVGWGFQPVWAGRLRDLNLVAIPFRVGWGGVFNVAPKEAPLVFSIMSQSLSGWGGVFNPFSTGKFSSWILSRNPFQGGVGFSTF